MAKQYLGTKLQELGNVTTLDPTDKIVIVQPADEGVMALSEFFFYVKNNLDFSNFLTAIQTAQQYAAKATVYTKTESDEKFSFIDRTYTKVQSDTKYALKDDHYTKAYIDNTFLTPGNVYVKSEVYTKNEVFTTFALKTELPILPDLTPYSTTAQGDTRWASKTDTYTKSASDARYATIDKSYSKADADARFANGLATYSKIEADAKFLDNDEGYTRQFIQNNIYFKTEVYTKLEAETRYALKANVYTIATINDQFAAKSLVYTRGEAESTFAPILTTYTKTEVNAFVNGQISALVTDLSSNYYTKTNADAKYATQELTYSRLVSDEKYALLSNTLTVTALATKYYDKTQIDTLLSSIDMSPLLTKVSAIATYATLANTYSITEMGTRYYTKTQVDATLTTLTTTINDSVAGIYLTPAAGDSRYAGISSVYTKTQTDTTFATKALTYSRTEANTTFPTKTATTTEIATAITALTTTIANDYVNKVAAEVYLTAASASTLYPIKSAVYTKAESDAKYVLPGVSYTKAEADTKYLAVGLTELNVVSPTSSATTTPTLTFTNKNFDANPAGKIVWKNESNEWGYIAAGKYNGSPGVAGAGQFMVYTKTSFGGLSKALHITNDEIWHSTYGSLHSYFAKTSDTYTKDQITSLLSNITNNYLSNTNAVATYATKTDFNTLSTSHTALTNTVADITTSLNTTYATKTYAYNKTESDGRYLKIAPLLELLGNSSTMTANGLSINNFSASGNDVGGITWKRSSTVLGSLGLNDTGAGATLILNLNSMTNGTYKETLKVTDEVIWHAKYGNLNSYFALSSDSYTKSQIDGKFTTAATLAYTKAETDAKYGLLSNLNAVITESAANKVSVTAVTDNLANNYYTKTQVLTPGTANSIYLRADGFPEISTNVNTYETSGLNIRNNLTSAKSVGGLHLHIGTKMVSTIYSNALTSDPHSHELVFVNKTSPTASATTMRVSKMGIWNYAYGDLHSFFAQSNEVYKKTDTYSKTESDGKFELKSVAYTKAQADARYPYRGDSYLKTEADAKFPTITNTYTKTEVDTKFVKQTDLTDIETALAIIIG